MIHYLFSYELNLKSFINFNLFLCEFSCLFCFFKVREELLRFIEEHLNKNIEACSLFDSLTEITNDDLHNIAVDLEYEAFTNSKVVSAYRRNIAKTVELY